MNTINRRYFLRTSLVGGISAAYASQLRSFASSAAAKPYGGAQVALTAGDDRADLAFRSLQPFSEEIRRAIGDKLVILKPNNVSRTIQLASTHADTLEGVLEFLKSINKLDNVIIAESAAGGSASESFSNFGYYRLGDKYNVKLLDLDLERFEILYVFDETDFRPHPVRVSSLLLDPGSYIVSVARMKTHDRVVATLSLKNIVLGAPIKDQGFSWGPDCKEGSRNDKQIVHGSGFRAINYNIAFLAQQLHPHLALIDGFEGMEGNGPNKGTSVDHRVCVAGTDWLAADRIGIELMGVDLSNVGYLNYSARMGLGEADLNSIEVIGEAVSDHIKKYRLNDNVDSQLIWKNPVGS